ncbi:tape measure protein [Brevibacterium sp.]|uniref:tape measure protein n=1 Tax=Brevibacterium sp. TaxID=1701 RepID=UPI0028116555|nr:tape measure protein [Brevibacterium sp.]
MASIASAFINVAPTFPGFQKKAADEAGKLENTFGRAGRKSGSGFAGALGKVVKGGVIATGTVAAAGLGYALTKGFERLSQIEDATASLTGLGHSAKSVKTIMNDALASVKGTSFGMGEAAQVAASAVAAGVKPGEDLQKTLKLTADAATIGKTSMSEMGMIFNKVASKDMIQADSANMLLERGIPIWQMLSKTMGMTTTEVQKLASEGKIGFAEFQTAMEQGLGGAALEVGNTTSGALKNIGAAAGRLGATLLGGVFPKIKPLFVSLIGVIDRMTDAAAPLGAAIGNILGPAIGRLSAWLDGLDFTKLSTGAGSMSWVAGAATHLKTSLAPLTPVVDLVGKALNWVWNNLGLVVRILPYALALFAAYRLASNLAAAATFNLRVAEMAMAPVYLANNIARITAITMEGRLNKAKHESILTKARDTAATSANTSATTANGFAARFAAAATKFQAGAMRSMYIQTNAAKTATIGSTVSLVAHRTATVATTIATRAAAVAQRLFNMALKASPLLLVVGLIAGIAFALQQFFTKTEEGRVMWSAFSAQIQAALLPLKAEFVKLQPLFAQLIGTLGSALGSIMPVVAQLVGTLVSTLVPVISNLARTLFPVLAQVIGTVVQVISSILAAVMPLVTVLLTALVPVIGLVLTVVAKIISVLATLLVPVIRFVGTVITWLVGAITTGVTSAGGVFATVFGAVSSFLTTVFAPVLNFIKTVAMLVFRGIQIYIQVWWAVVSAIFSLVVAIIRTVLAPVFTFFKNAVTLAFNLILAAINFWWTLAKIVFNAVVGFIRDQLQPRFNLFKDTVASVFQTVRQKIDEAWTFIKTWIFNPIVSFLKDKLAPAFTSAKDTITGAWTKMQNHLDQVRAFIVDNIFRPVMDLVKNTLPDAFETGRDAIGKAWDGLKSLARKPIAFVIEQVVRDGLVKPFNKVAGVFGSKTIDEKLFTVPKLRDGGPVPGHSPTPTADNIPIWATAGEFMVRRRAADRLRRQHPGALEYINSRGELPMVRGYKKGGDIVALGRALQSIGVRVSEHPKFGGVNPVHAKNSWHYRAGALDLNTAAGQSKGEMAFFDKLMPILHGLGWGTIWRYPNHYGHAHVDKGGRKLGSFKTGGVGGLVAKGLMAALKGLKNLGGSVGNALVDLNPFKGLIDKIKNGIGKEPFAQMIGSGATNLVNKAIEWMQEKMPFGGDTGDINDPGGQGAGVGRWTDTVKQALTMLGQPTSQAMINTVLRRMKQESGGNPKAINNWDINAKRGTPSKGLMQVIGPTFKAYAMKGFKSNIYDPLSNILASMRYALARYGSLSKAYNRKGGYAKGGLIQGFASGGLVPSMTGGAGDSMSFMSGMMPKPVLYDDGGWLPPGLTTVLNATGKPEPVFTPKQLGMIGADSAEAQPRMQFGDVYVQDPDEFVRTLDERERKRDVLYPV